MEFLVEFDVIVPDGTPDAAIEARKDAEASAAAELVEQGHLLRVWKGPGAPGETRIIGLYSAESRAQLDGLLADLPLYEWMDINVTALDPHPNDPATTDAAVGSAGPQPATNALLPEPRLTLVYRLEATVGEPLDLGEIGQGRRRIVTLTGGTFAGPEMSGTLVPGVSADWQVVLPDGTALGDIRYTLRTDAGDLLYVQSRSVRHGSAEVLSRLGRGEDVDPSEYTFRTATQIETAAGDLDWLNKGIFISVGGRQAGAVVYETYLVG